VNPTLRLALIVPIVSALITSAAAQQAPPAPPVTVAKPVVKDIVEWDEFTGRFDAIGAVEIRSRVGGYLESVHFQDGTLVKEGDLLFVIERRGFRAALNQAEASLVATQTRFDLSKLELERAERLVKSGAGTEQSLDQRRQAFLGLQADLTGARAAVEQLRLNLEYAEIRAPISGRISRKLVSEGNLVNANTTMLTTIVSVDPIHFYFDVDERSYLAYSRMARAGSTGDSVGSEVFLATSDEKELKRKGTIDFVDNRVDAATGTMRLRAKVPNPDGYLTPGMFGRVAIQGSPNYKGILLPDEAIASDQTRRIVYAVDKDGNTTAKVVRPGPRIDGYRVIREGLTGDEMIVVDGLMRVRPGVKVAPKPTTLPPTRATP
jgi:multidrug efflux system membrane fusion protein